MNKKHSKVGLYLFFSGFFLSGLAVGSKIQSAELSHLFSGSAKVWQVTPESFRKIQGNNGFNWSSERQRETMQSTNSSLQFLGINVVEAAAYFAAA